MSGFKNKIAILKFTVNSLQDGSNIITVTIWVSLCDHFSFICTVYLTQSMHKDLNTSDGIGKGVQISLCDIILDQIDIELKTIYNYRVIQVAANTSKHVSIHLLLI